MKRRAILLGLLINSALIAATIFVLIESYNGQPGSTLGLMAIPPLVGCILVVTGLILAISLQPDTNTSAGYRNVAFLLATVGIALGLLAFAFG